MGGIQRLMGRIACVLGMHATRPISESKRSRWRLFRAPEIVLEQCEHCGRVWERWEGGC